LTAQVSTVVAVFGNLQMSSLFGDRSGVSIDVSTERYFEFDQLAIRGKQRFDIVNHSLGTTSVAGPVIALKTPAS
jgi:HK97 family phage major capsid protein